LSTRSPPQCEIVLARNYPLSPNTNQGGDGGATRVRSLGTVRRPDSNGEGNAMSKLWWAAAVVCASATASAAQGLQTLGGHAHHDPLPASLPDRGEFGRSDWADLDGNLLISNDPFECETVKDGRIFLSGKSGLGLELINESILGQ